MKKRKEFLPFSKPSIGQEEIDEVIDTLRSGWITTGVKTHKFEDDFRKYTQSKFAIALSSCTAALHLALIAANVERDDEVITTPFTFAATTEVILYQNAKPVFVDIKEDTYNIDSKKIEEKITDKTKAIIPVHYGGQPCDMDEIMKIAKKHNLVVIEDAAHALGAKCNGRIIGSIGDFTTFSFYPTKNITTVEGGMITTDDEKSAEKIRILSLHGISKDAWNRYTKEGSWYYEILEKGYKYNMTDIQAALGIHQLKKIEKFIKIRDAYAKQYTKGFEDVEEIITPYLKKNIRHAWHLYPIRIDTGNLRIKRNEFIEKLKEKGIGTSVHFIPLHLHPFYRKTFNYQRGDFPVTEKVYENIISLPIYPAMSRKDVKYVIHSVREIIKENRK
jgi:UDP-4-amino-4,6-dideoxy-N-acetyl-beta-L-altrosamine transaminase